MISPIESRKEHGKCPNCGASMEKRPLFQSNESSRKFFTLRCPDCETVVHESGF